MLIADGTYSVNWSGIGSTGSGSAGTIRILGGTITASGGGSDDGGNGGAGIGGGNKGSGGMIEILGGDVSATGCGCGSGIGAGCVAAGGTVRIYDGKVTAAGHSVGNGAGIGGGGAMISTGYSGGVIEIYGGDVTATGGGSYGAGIGGGGNQNRNSTTHPAGSAGTISISGGKVTASSVNGAAIGSGSTGGTGAAGSAGTIRISGGSIKATSTGGAGIGGGKKGSDGSFETLGTLYLGWASDAPENHNPIIISSSYQCSVSYDDPSEPFQKKGGVTALSTTEIQSFTTKTTIHPMDGSVEYLYVTGDEDVHVVETESRTKAAGTFSIVSASDTSWGTSGQESWLYVCEDTAISGRVTVSGDVNLILGNDTALNIDTGGIAVTGGNSLTIYQQTTGEDEMPGILTAGSGSLNSGYNAGIGGNGSGSVRGGTTTGTIIINGGDITAQGPVGGSNNSAPGIGGANNGKDSGTVIINYGSVTATHGAGGSCAGIGGGGNTPGGTIIINGGTVNASGSPNGSGIGGGGSDINNADVSGGSISIYGGSITASSAGGGAGIGGGAGGGSGVNRSAGAILICGGTVNASSTSGAGIGGGANTKSGALTLAWADEDGSSGKPEITASKYAVNVSYADSSHKFHEIGGTAGVTLSASEIEALEGATIVPYTGAVKYLAVTVASDHSVSSDEELCYDYLTVSSTDIAWGTAEETTWIYVGTDTSISDRVTVTGEVHLILGNNTLLTASKGISVLEGNSITIYQQPLGEDDEMGRLSATGTDHCAGIGGNEGLQKSNGSYTEAQQKAGFSGQITINGGNITASGSNWGAGIGGGNFGKTEPITINGGVVNATGGSLGAGIGAGVHYSCDEITINGGTVVAQGGGAAPGIGAGARNAAVRTVEPGPDGNIYIYGGTVTATGGSYNTSAYGAGIGGGANYINSTSGFGNVSSITISGGNVTATGAGSAAGIGGGAGTYGTGTAETITISGGTINASSASGSGIGGSADTKTGTLTLAWASDAPDEHNPIITSTSYSVSAVQYADAAKTFQLDVVPSALTTDQIAAFTETTTIYPFAGEAVVYLDVNVDRTDTHSHPVTTSEETCAIYTTVTASTTAFDGSLNDGWYVADGAVTVSSRITVTGDVKLILKNGSTLTAQEGIGVAPGQSLTIYQQPEDGKTTGKLIARAAAGSLNAAIGGSNTATGTIVINGGTIDATSRSDDAVSTGSCGAAIGGGSDKAGGTIIINGGTVNAVVEISTVVGDNRAAAIGSGGSWQSSASGKNRNNSTRIEINGGTVTAIGGRHSAGIGGGELYQGGTIDIYGGTVTSTGKMGGAGIGGGYDSDAGTISIYGGTISATAAVAYNSKKGAGIGCGCYDKGGGYRGSIYISGGTINASSWDGGHGIGNGNSNRTSGTAINLDWTKDTFDSTEITADGYMGTVTFIKPYIRKADKVLAKKSNMDDVTIIPGFAVDGIMAEGRKYENDGFTEESTSISVPVNRGLTVRMDLDVLNSGEEEMEYTFTDMTARFTSALPKDTLITLTVISGTDESPVYKHYYAVLGKSQSRVQLTAFADMERR